MRRDFGFQGPPISRHQRLEMTLQIANAIILAVLNHPGFLDLAAAFRIWYDCPPQWDSDRDTRGRRVRNSERGIPDGRTEPSPIVAC